MKTLQPKDQQAQSATVLSVHADSATMRINSVGILNVNGGRFAEIQYGITGEMSVLLTGADDVASLFASADAEFESAHQSMCRAMRMRNAAWKLSVDRTNAAAAK